MEKSCVLDVVERFIIALGILCLLLAVTSFSRDMFLGSLFIIIGWYLIMFWVTIPRIRCQKDVDEESDE